MYFCALCIITKTYTLSTGTSLTKKVKKVGKKMAIRFFIVHFTYTYPANKQGERKALPIAISFRSRQALICRDAACYCTLTDVLQYSCIDMI